MNTATPLSVSQKVYRLSLAWRIAPFLLTLALVAFVWIVTFLGRSTVDSGFLTFLIIFSFGFPILGALLCLLTVSTRIVTMPEGIIYYNSGLCLYSPWENIVGLEKIVMGVRSVDSLRLRLEAVDGVSLQEGMKEHLAVMTKAPALQTVEDALPFLKALVMILSVIALLGGNHPRLTGLSSSGRVNPRSIPVGLFGQQWEYGQLHRDIQRYASHAVEDSRPLFERLFEQEAKEKEPQPKAVSPPTQPPPTWRE